ncbi:MAG: outer membrane protein assembly factor BamE domain-containing protein [Gemmatimonadaceae bacterium]
MRKIPLVALLLVAIAASARAQAASIDPGMSREQVIARLGQPVSEHSSGTRTYLYYRNGDEKKYGMHDLVALENGKVVDAVFRSSARTFSGKSSSPEPVSAEAAIAKGHGGHIPAAKILPPTQRTHEPLKGTDTKKIAPATKTPDSAKKGKPAPTKKP